MRSALPLLCCFAFACALPVASDPQLERVDQPLPFERRAGSPCRPPAEKAPWPGKPSCPECLVQPFGDDLYALNIPTSLTQPVYLGDPSQPDEAVEVWPGGEPGESGLLRLVVPWQSPTAPTLPSPIQNLATPALFALGPFDCTEVLAPHDESFTHPIESVGSD